MIQQELQRDDQTLQTIGQIDAQIQSIYNNLEALSVQTNPDVNKQNALLQQIQQLQALKSSLYTSVSASYASNQANVAESRNSLVDEIAVTGIVGKELQNATKNLSALEQARYNKVRMAEINNYYSAKYDTQSKVMKTIVYFCVPILILGILTKKEFIPQNSEEYWQIYALDSIASQTFESIVSRAREKIYKPEEFHYPDGIKHEKGRALRSLSLLEKESHLFIGSYNKLHVTIGLCCLVLDNVFPDEAWKENKPNLVKIYEDFKNKDSFIETIKKD